MEVANIILVIISGLGVIHGLLLAILLLGYKKGNALSNKLLSILLLVLSFRIGKSVILEFAESIDIKLIFTGLSTIMAIGPLFLFFTKSCMNKSWVFKKEYLVHFIPSTVGFALGLYLSQYELESWPKLIFAGIFITYYLHMLFYLIFTYQLAKKEKELNKEVFNFLRWLFYGLMAIWLVYVLNLFDEVVPYIVGPILYSIIAYAISYLVFSKGYIAKISENKYKTNPVSQEQSDQLYLKIVKIVEDDEQYKNNELTLTSIGNLLKVSPQIISLVINQKSEQNFNSFINTYRINESIKLLQEEAYKHQTIASIANEIGFNSISTFNTAFKKQTGITPTVFKKQLTK